jgi:hypothetical protein
VIAILLLLHADGLWSWVTVIFTLLLYIVLPVTGIALAVKYLRRGGVAEPEEAKDQEGRDA